VPFGGHEGQRRSLSHHCPDREFVGRFVGEAAEFRQEPGRLIERMDDKPRPDLRSKGMQSELEGPRRNCRLPHAATPLGINSTTGVAGLTLGWRLWLDHPRDRLPLAPFPYSDFRIPGFTERIPCLLIIYSLFRFLGNFLVTN
jgi:hypothetical protein